MKLHAVRKRTYSVHDSPGNECMLAEPPPIFKSYLYAESQCFYLRPTGPIMHIGWRCLQWIQAKQDFYQF